MPDLPRFRRLPEYIPPFVSILLLAVSATGCARTSMRWQGAGRTEAGSNGPILVLITPAPALPPDSANFSARLLALVREQDPRAELVHGNGTLVSQLALGRDARFLLEAKVLRWRDAQTRYSGEPDEIAIDLRLITQSSAVVRELKFRARGSRLAIRDAAADRLLNEKFRKAVRQLLASRQP